MKTAFAVAMLACLFFLVQVPSAAAAGPGVGEFCTANGDLGLGHDTCVTLLNSGVGNGPTAACKLLEDIAPGIIEAVFGNHGQCVVVFTQL